MIARLAPVALLIAAAPWPRSGTPGVPPDVDAIVDRSAAVMAADWAAAPDYAYCEQDRDDHGTKTYDVTMIQGSSYFRLVAVDGIPLSPDERQAERKKLEAAIAAREAEPPAARAKRIADYRKDLERNRTLLREMVHAFTFTVEGESQLESRQVYVVGLVPRPGYRPPNVTARALTGMKGTLWIDTATLQWVKATASVQRPITVAGFLARIEPGTRFLLEDMPVDANVWLPKRFVMNTRARILFIFPRRTLEDDTFFDYRRAEPPSADAVSRPACVPHG